MKKMFLFLLLAASLRTAYAQTEKARLDSLLSYYAAQYNFNGVAFVAIKGNILLSKGYGYRDVAHKIKHDENSVFQIGSVTKQFTAEAILQLAAAGQLSLQDNLTKFFPAYPNGDKITVHNLLTHTSGIFNYTNDTVWMLKSTHATQDELMASFKDRPLEFEPGSKFEYSNSNYLLLGFIIEKVTGKKYEAVVRERILKPGGMTHSGFDFAGLQDKNKSIGYYVAGDTNTEEAGIVDSSVSFAAGALYSTVGDMYKWHKALQSYNLLTKDWQAKAYIPFKKRYAYGWFIDSIAGKRVIVHSGGIPGFVSYILRIEEEDMCMVLMSNYMGGAVSENEMAIQVTKALYDKNFVMPKVIQDAKLDMVTINKYVGEYVLAPGFSITISAADNKVYAQGTGQSSFEIYPESENMFYTKVVAAKIEFVKDEKGNVNKMILHQGGRDMPGLKK